MGNALGVLLVLWYSSVAVSQDIIVKELLSRLLLRAAMFLCCYVWRLYLACTWHWLGFTLWHPQAEPIQGSFIHVEQKMNLGKCVSADYVFNFNAEW